MNADFIEKMNRDREKLTSLTIEAADTTMQYEEAMKYLKGSYYRSLKSVLILLIPALLIHGDIFNIYHFVGPFMVFALFMLVAHAFAYNWVKAYYILKDVILPLLETGELLQQKILWKWQVAYRVFTSFWVLWLVAVLIFGWEENPEPVIFMGGYLMLGLISLAVSAVLFFKESERLGISALVSAVYAVFYCHHKNYSASSESYNPSDLTNFKNITNASNPLSPINQSTANRY